jgi:hypothetical protein
MAKALAGVNVVRRLPKDADKEDVTMADTATLDRAFTHIMRRFVRTGQAPHYTELAKELGVSTEEGRQLIADLMNAGVPGWLHPQTDYIASFPPFNNQPTQYRISIDGHQKWFAQ